MDLPAFLGACSFFIVFMLTIEDDCPLSFSFSSISSHFSLSPAQNLGGRNNRGKAQRTNCRSMMPKKGAHHSTQDQGVSSRAVQWSRTGEVAEIHRPESEIPVSCADTKKSIRTFLIRRSWPCRGNESFHRQSVPDAGQSDGPESVKSQMCLFL